jgi:hypothetical protein
MKTDPERESAQGPFGNISEAERRAALDAFGQMLMNTRDASILHWDAVLAGGRYPPWDRLLRRCPELDERSREVLREALPHIVDSVLYHLLADLEASQAVRVSVMLENKTFANIARLSWGLPAEPAGDDGWLVRFSKQRFEQPY